MQVDMRYLSMQLPICFTNADLRGFVDRIITLRRHGPPEASGWLRSAAENLEELIDARFYRPSGLGRNQAPSAEDQIGVLVASAGLVAEAGYVSRKYGSSMVLPRALFECALDISKLAGVEQEEAYFGKLVERQNEALRRFLVLEF